MEHSLRRILPSDKRQNINRKFDDSVAEFFAMAYHFDCEIEAVPENKTMGGHACEHRHRPEQDARQGGKSFRQEIPWL